jgi:hypothetical protein
LLFFAFRSGEGKQSERKWKKSMKLMIKNVIKLVGMVIFRVSFKMILNTDEKRILKKEELRRMDSRVLHAEVLGFHNSPSPNTRSSLARATQAVSLRPLLGPITSPGHPRWISLVASNSRSRVIYLHRSQRVEHLLL